MGKLRGIIVILVLTIFYSVNVYGEENRNIEIFDINKEMVVKVVKPNEEIEGITVSYLNEIDGFIAKCDPIPPKGYAVRIPLKSSLKMENQWINGTISEVVVVFPDKELQPFLVVFENGERFLCLSSKGDFNKLSKALELKL